MTNLQNLLARVQAATGPDPELDGLVAKVAREIPPDAVFMRENAYGQESDTWYTGGYGAYVYHYPELYTDSIDAALALVNRLLPTFGVQVGHPLREHRQYGWYASVFRERLPSEDGIFAGHFDGGKDHADLGTPEPYRYFPNGALAILAALLTALIANQKGTETK